MPSNKEFLTALFGDDWMWVHVTDFSQDPFSLKDLDSPKAWAGNFFSRYSMGEVTNQYFCISTFFVGENDRAQRRKALYRQTHVIVLDDVKEKLFMGEVSKLPEPSWVLETSPGSEQWGYILEKPVGDRGRVENLLDGLVANGLAPDGRDPGMKGVTRYVRLPDGYNMKESKFVDGQPFKCRITQWNPERKTTLEALAAPFAVNLNVARREARVDGAADVSDHPLLTIRDEIKIKEVRSAGRFEITCPWVDEHTNEDDSGTAVFTNADGTIGFKCHHGNCQDKTGRDFLGYVNQLVPGFVERMTKWQVQNAFAGIAKSTPEPEVSFLTPPPPPQVVTEEEASIAAVVEPHIQELKKVHPFGEEARKLSATILQVVDSLPPIDRLHWQNEVRDIMQWSKSELNDIIKKLRQSWYIESSTEASFFNEVIFIAELNQFFDRKKRIFYSAEAYQNAYSHKSGEVRKEALQGGMVKKVDKLEYAPLQASVFERAGVTYGNSWDDVVVESFPGDVSRFLDHFDAIGWGPHRKHILQWMAYTLRHPDKKINHMMILGSPEGGGKDWLLYPLIKAMGENHTMISAEELLADFNDYALSTKHLHINEAELGDRRDAEAVSSKMKLLAAAPPEKIRVNQKGIKPISINNLLSVSMTTNSQLPLRLSGQSRRIFAVWSDINVRDEEGNMRTDWAEYWADRWHWMKNGGAEMCIDYLRNQVDLADFAPGAPPPVTEFLQDIQEASKSPGQQTIEAFIKAGIGAFQADLITPQDMSDTLRLGGVVAPNLMYTDSNWFTPTRVGIIMRSIPGCGQKRAQSSGNSYRVWVVRNLEKYVNMPQSDLYHEYERQLKVIRQSAQLKSVK